MAFLYVWQAATALLRRARPASLALLNVKDPSLPIVWGEGVFLESFICIEGILRYQAALPQLRT